MTQWIQMRLFKWIYQHRKRGRGVTLTRLGGYMAKYGPPRTLETYLKPGYKAEERKTFHGFNTQSSLSHDSGAVPMVHTDPPPNQLPPGRGVRGGGGCQPQ